MGLDYVSSQKDKQRSTKHTHKTKDRGTRTPLKTGCELRYSGRINSSCSTRLVNLVTNRWWTSVIFDHACWHHSRYTTN